MNIVVQSPLTGGQSEIDFEIDKNELIKRYIDEYDVDISHLVADVDKIHLYKCLKSGYRFFFPYTLAGNGNFYEQLQKISGYYPKWKWDYEVAIKEIPYKSKVLDIGCGEGYFLSKLKSSKQCDCFGLELNDIAMAKAIQNGVKVTNEELEQHAQKNIEQYDVVTFFQVLEHIAEPGKFLHSVLKTVKKGGQIILTVPNNQPYYLEFDKFHLLNLPPHHMGWWNKESLESLLDFFPLKLGKIETQPLEHYYNYTKSFLLNYFPNSQNIRRLFYPFFKVLFYLRRKTIKGASIMAVYTKI